MGLVADVEGCECNCHERGLGKSCEHVGADECVSNVGGLTAFLDALARVGKDSFPTLVKELTGQCYGSTLPQASRLALKELEAFQRLTACGRNPVLVNSQTGLVFYHHIASYEGIIHSSKEVEVGFDDRGFFVRDTLTKMDRFRAMRVQQTLLRSDESGIQTDRASNRSAEFHDLDNGQTFVEILSRISNQPVEFRDLDNGQTFVGIKEDAIRHQVPWPDGRNEDDRGYTNHIHPTEFHVELRERATADFAYIIDSLIILFRASVATGNPVNWYS